MFPLFCYIKVFTNWFTKLGNGFVKYLCILLPVKSRDTLTTGIGSPVGNKNASQTVGPRGPVLLQDFVFTDEMAHFNRERIPERVVHAKGAGIKTNKQTSNKVKKRLYSKPNAFCIKNYTCIFTKDIDLHA